MNNIMDTIKKDRQIWKFCFYGLLKNLNFFEPYLLIFLMSKGLNLFQIGLLITVREIIINLFEIPSGILADYFGRKKELYFCFSFYIISFICFYMTNSFLTAVIAMIFYGLGNAFRSGTHKAMIYSYLDHKEWTKHKTFVYGRTRSFSLIGSAISSLVAIIIVLSFSDVKYIFLFSVIPYVLEFLLIMTYPKFLDKSDKESHTNIKQFVSKLIKSFKENKNLRNILVETGLFDASFSYIKDFIQPIIEMIVLTSGILLIDSLSTDDNLTIILGLVYFIFNLISAGFSRYAYIIKGNKTNIKCLSIIHITLALVFLMLFFVIENSILVMLLYIVIYVLFSFRKPIFVDEIDNHISKSNRATVISISSQLKSIMLIIFAPILGLVADRFGINIVLLILALTFIITTPLIKNIKKGE